MCEPTAPTFHPRTPCSHLTHFVPPTHTHSHTHTLPHTLQHTHLLPTHTFPHTPHTTHPPTPHIPRSTRSLTLKVIPPYPGCTMSLKRNWSPMRLGLWSAWPPPETTTTSWSLSLRPFPSCGLRLSTSSPEC